MDKYTVTVAYPHYMQDDGHLHVYTESVLAITPEEAGKKVQSMASEANRVDGNGPGAEEFDILSVSRDETYESVFINSIINEDTGGGCRVDFIELKDGTLLTLNDDAICWHKDRKSFEEGADVPTIYFVDSDSHAGAVANAIRRLSDAIDALDGILNAMNVDMDGDYFICAECEPMIEAAKVIARNARKSYLKVRGIA